MTTFLQERQIQAGAMGLVQLCCVSSTSPFCSSGQNRNRRRFVVKNAVRPLCKKPCSISLPQNGHCIGFSFFLYSARVSLMRRAPWLGTTTSSACAPTGTSSCAQRSRPAYLPSGRSRVLCSCTARSRALGPQLKTAQ